MTFRWMDSLTKAVCLGAVAALLGACQSATATPVVTVVPPTVPLVTAGAASASPPAAGTGTLAATGAVTGTPAAAGTGPLLIDNATLIGLEVYDNGNRTGGRVGDVLLDMTGTVRALVVDLSPVGGGPTGTPTVSAGSTLTVTPGPIEGSQTPGAGTGPDQFVAVDWSQLRPDPASNHLIYQGTVADLSHQTRIDEANICEAYIIPHGSSGSTEPYAGLWRLGVQLAAVNLQDTQGRSLGALQDVVLDLGAGRAAYALVDVGQYLSGTVGTAQPQGSPAVAVTSSGTGQGGTGPTGTCGTQGAAPAGTPPAVAPTAAGSQLIAVPWERLKVDTSDPTSSTPVVRIDLTPATLQGAPAFDPGQTHFWPTAATVDWDAALKAFWAKH